MTTKSGWTHRKALLYEIFHPQSRRLPSSCELSRFLGGRGDFMVSSMGSIRPDVLQYPTLPGPSHYLPRRSEGFDSWSCPDEHPHFPVARTRREFLRRPVAASARWRCLAAAAGRGAGRVRRPATRTRPGRPHFPAKAKRVIYLFMHGGPSHLETFDPKPDLQRLAGQPLPASFGHGRDPSAGRGEPAAGHQADVPHVRPERPAESPTSSRTSPTAPTSWR